MVVTQFSHLWGFCTWLYYIQNLHKELVIIIANTNYPVVYRDFFFKALGKFFFKTHGFWKRAIICLRPFPVVIGRLTQFRVMTRVILISAGPRLRLALRGVIYTLWWIRPSIQRTPAFYLVAPRIVPEKLHTKLLDDFPNSKIKRIKHKQKNSNFWIQKNGFLNFICQRILCFKNSKMDTNIFQEPQSIIKK